MIRIAVVGGMGSGKSACTQAFAARGAAVLDLDSLGHEALLLQKVKDELKAAFGAQVADEAGNIDRSALAHVAFASKEAHAALEGIVHPVIASLLKAKLAEFEAAGKNLCVIEASAVRSRSDLNMCAPDYVVAVVAPRQLRMARVMAKGFSEDDACARMHMQASDSELCAFADICFSNEGTKEDLCKKVLQWLGAVLS